MIRYQRYHFRLRCRPHTTTSVTAIKRTFSSNRTCIISISLNFVTILIVLHMDNLDLSLLQVLFTVVINHIGGVVILSTLNNL